MANAAERERCSATDHATSFVILDNVPAYSPIYQLVMLLVSNGVPQVVPVYVEVFQSSMLMQ